MAPSAPPKKPYSRVTFQEQSVARQDAHWGSDVVNIAIGIAGHVIRACTVESAIRAEGYSAYRVPSKMERVLRIQPDPVAPQLVDPAPICPLVAGYVVP